MRRCFGTATCAESKTLVKGALCAYVDRSSFFIIKLY